MKSTRYPASLTAMGRRVTLLALLCSAGFVAGAQAQSIVMASTTSTEQSGLFPYLLPEFKKATGVDVKVVAVGTGRLRDDGGRNPVEVEVGQTVLFTAYAGTEAKVNEETYLILALQDVVALLD